MARKVYASSKHQSTLSLKPLDCFICGDQPDHVGYDEGGNQHILCEYCFESGIDEGDIKTPEWWA